MKKTTILIILLSTILTSCSIAYLRLMDIRKGMNLEEVAKILESDSYNSKDVTLINDAKTDTYDLTKNLSSESKVQVLIAHKYYEGQKGSKTPFYLFSFENSKLVFWGLPVEFLRSNNEKIRKIGEESVSIISKKYSEE